MSDNREQSRREKALAWCRAVWTEQELDDVESFPGDEPSNAEVYAAYIAGRRDSDESAAKHLEIYRYGVETRFPVGQKFTIDSVLSMLMELATEIREGR